MSKGAKKKKLERKFCLTPPNLDPCWVKMEMEVVDEVVRIVGSAFGETCMRNWSVMLRRGLKAG